MSTPHTHGGTDASECTTCREIASTLTPEERRILSLRKALSDAEAMQAQHLEHAKVLWDEREAWKSRAEQAEKRVEVECRLRDEYKDRAERAEAVQDRVLLRVEEWRSLYPMTVRFPERYASEIMDTLLDIDRGE